MTFAALVFTLAAAVLSALCAAADGALLSLDVDAPLPDSLAGLHARRERAHRALAFARVIGQLGAGIGVALILATVGLPGPLAVIVGVLAAIVLVSLSESVARSVGDTRGPDAARRLLPFIRTLEHLLAPVAAFGELIGDESFQTLDKLMQAPVVDQRSGKPERTLFIRAIRIVDAPVEDATLQLPQVSGRTDGR